MTVDLKLNVFSGEDGLRDFYDPDKNLPVPVSIFTFNPIHPLKISGLYSLSSYLRVSTLSETVFIAYLHLNHSLMVPKMVLGSMPNS